MNKKALRGKKKLMYEALKGQLGNISAACNQVGINRSTHYDWLAKDPNYKLWVQEAPELTKDFVEHQLMKQIKSGNMTGIIFYLKTKAKDRGYIEKQEIEHQSKGEGFKLIIHEPKDEK